MLTKNLPRKYIFPSCHPLEFITYRLWICIYVMLIHESHVFQLQSETKFEVCDPQSVFFFKRYLCYKEEGLKFSGLTRYCISSVIA